MNTNGGLGNLMFYEDTNGISSVSLAAIQTVLFLAHFLIYETWTFSSGGCHAPGPLWLKSTFGVLSVSFLAASLLAFRYTNATLRLFYRAAAVWLGLLSFLFLAAVSSWVVFGASRSGGVGCELPPDRGSAFRRCDGGWVLRSFQCKLDAHHANYGAAGEPAGGMARAQSGADQRCASGARAEWQFSAAHGGEDFEGRAARNFYRGRFV